MSKRVLAVIPAYNEEENIVGTVEDLEKNAPGVDYIVIDDGSKDSTPDICRNRGYRMASLPVNLGLAGGFQTGMKYAKRNGYQYVVQFDADGQHSAAYIPQLVMAAEQSGSDIVIGSRFANKKKPFSARMMGSALISLMIRITTGKRITDPTSGMRLFNVKVIPWFADELDYGPEPDTMALAMRRGAKVQEVQVEMRERTAGESYFSFTKSVSYMLRMSVSILFVQWFRRKK